MISIRKYLYGQSGAQPDGTHAGRGAAAWCLVLELLAGIERYALAGEHAECAGRQATVRGVRDGLETKLSPEQAVAAARTVCAAMEQHTVWAREWNRRQAAEIQKMVAMLNETIAVLSSGSQRSLSRLRRVERDIERASEIEDLVAMRAQLSDCLVYVREESAREREEVARAVLEMEQRVRAVREELEAARSGMPGREEAERAIGSGDWSYALVLVLDRFRAVHARFGAAAAEQLLAHFTAEVLDRLPDPKKVFRWSSCSVVVLMESAKGAEAAAEVREALRTIPLEHKVEVGNRIALLMQSHHWAMPALAGRSVEEAAQDIDRLVQSIDPEAGTTGGPSHG